MKLEDQVVSLKLARELKELGVRQESYFYWKTENSGQSYQLNGDSFPFGFFRKNTIAAFTVAELGGLMHWKTLYILDLPEELLHFIDSVKTEANARAKMLIHLIENKLIDLRQ